MSRAANGPASFQPTHAQHAVLVETMRVSTVCFNATAAYGWAHEQRNSVELHKATYYSLRAEHPTLPSQLVISSRMRAGEAISSALTRRKRAEGRRPDPEQWFPSVTTLGPTVDRGAASLASVKVVKLWGTPPTRTRVNCSLVRWIRFCRPDSQRRQALVARGRHSRQQGIRGHRRGCRC